MQASNSQRYFRCQASVTIDQLRKLIEAKYATTAKHQVRFFYNEIQLPEHLTLLDVAYISAWKRVSVVNVLLKLEQYTGLKNSRSDVHLIGSNMSI